MVGLLVGFCVIVFFLIEYCMRKKSDLLCMYVSIPVTTFCTYWFAQLLMYVRSLL